MAHQVPTLEQLRKQRDEILRLAAMRRAYNVRVFGSVARGDATQDSDIDLLVTFRNGATLYDLSGLWQDLHDLLGYKVNVLSDNGLREAFRRSIESDITAL
jgi:hypothetical protein